jgi:hypothetical protein
MILRRWLAAAAVAWALVNLGGMGFALVQGEMMHGGVHGALAVVLAVAAGWLWRKPASPQREIRVDMLEDEVSDLQRQLNEAQQGRDFAEQLLAQRAKEREANTLRYAPKPERGSTGADDSTT